LQTRQQLQQLRKDLATPIPLPNPVKQEDNTPNIIAPKPVQHIKELKLSSSGEYDDDEDEPDAKRGKLNGGETKQEVSLAIPDPKNANGLVYPARLQYVVYSADIGNFSTLATVLS
jgi:hypothetical protein